MHMELEGIMYVGGVFKDMYPKLPTAVMSRNGFEGCLASIDFADISPSLTDDAVVPSSLLGKIAEYNVMSIHTIK